MLLQHFLAAATLLGSAYAQTKLKIMPLGDSITEITCWRTIVWQNLQAAGVANNADFVGTMSNNPQNCASSGGAWDQNHEGHSGYTAINIANVNLGPWLQANRPDIVMFMLGTNDITGRKSASDIIGAYNTIVSKLRASNPRIRIIVDLVIPITVGNYATLGDLNRAIPGWASGLSTANSPIVVANTSNGYPSNGLRDGIHPNAAGDAFIASKISPVLIDQIKQALSGTTPATSQTGAATTMRTTTAASGGAGAPLYGQCGGSGWTGPTTCASGKCTVSNQWYSQCL